MRLLDRRLLPFLPSFMVLSAESLLDGAGLVLAANERVRGRRREDRLAVLKGLTSELDGRRCPFRRGCRTKQTV